MCSAHRPRSWTTIGVDGLVEDPPQTTVEVGREFRGRGLRGRRQPADDGGAAGREEREAIPGQVPETALHAVTGDGVAHRAADDEADPSGRADAVVAVGDEEMDDEGVGRRTTTPARDEAQVGPSDE